MEDVMANDTPQGSPPKVVIPGAGWVDMLSRVIVQVGFPIVVAGVLLWFLLTRFQENMDTITGRMEHNATVVAAFVEELKTHTVELKAQTEYLADQSKLLADQGKLMGQIAQDASRLVNIRQQELDYMKQHQGQP